MEKIEINYEDCLEFPSGWSLHPSEIYMALKHVVYNDKINILEFGSGEGTKNLIKLLNNKNIKFYYKSYEHDGSYCTLNNVDYVQYDSDNIKNIILDDKVYDLVIVDGPHGVSRSLWYEKFKSNVITGSIVLIDDFHHYQEFDEELNKNYLYELITVYNQDTRWELVNNGVEIYDPYKYSSCEKTFKIVKIIKSLI